MRGISLLVVVLLVAGLIRGMRSDLHMLANTAILLPHAVADLFGRDSAYICPASTNSSPIAPWRDYLKPIQSDHWGQR